jgi:hypothetical protein
MSEVDICNAALIKLGADTITALTDDNVRGRTMNSRYAGVRDAELRRHRWRFSIARVSLPALSSTPDSDYDFQYQVPNDFLRLIEGGDILSIANLTDFRSASNALYSLEGRAILTNLGAPLAIRHIAQITDTATFDAAFTEALAARLAFECCKKITGNETEKESCWADYKNAIREAIRANALEAAPQDPADDSWVVARAR